MEENLSIDDKIRELAKRYTSLFEEAYHTVRSGRVKKYIFTPSRRILWIVVGRQRDYLILQKANFCTCDDFFFRVLDHAKPMCYHILAVKIAELTNRYETVEESDSWYKRLLSEWLSSRKE
ncbi:MAG TPA: hypothetical protein EYH45_04065 [Candidatus Caldiarchaeum subterraneum]|uniref:SWIM-type domain-containing protein n=1 Tax=Caldiarchaeum subterraneum TaxID=311458 RepID=A0A833ECE8_CALS0|nr:hypothetical protein [Candidatus Caldarchaeum subterraneum]